MLAAKNDMTSTELVSAPLLLLGNRSAGRCDWQHDLRGYRTTHELSGRAAAAAGAMLAQVLDA